MRLRPGQRRFRDLLERERQDVRMLGQHVAEMYDEITAGQISKPNTKPFEVIALYEERIDREVEEAVEDATELARANWRDAFDTIRAMLAHPECPASLRQIAAAYLPPSVPDTHHHGPNVTEAEFCPVCIARGSPAPSSKESGETVA